MSEDGIGSIDWGMMYGRSGGHSQRTVKVATSRIKPKRRRRKRKEVEWGWEQEKVQRRRPIYSSCLDGQWRWFSIEEHDAVRREEARYKLDPTGRLIYSTDDAGDVHWLRPREVEALVALYRAG